MARAKVEVNEKALRSAVAAADKEGLKGRTQVIERAAKLYADKTGIVAGVGRLRRHVTDLNLKIKTKGTPGRPAKA